MKVIKAGYEPIVEVDVLKKIERVARICYKSEDKITEGSDVRMVSQLIKRQHLAMLEHASLCFEVDDYTYDDMIAFLCELRELVEKEVINIAFIPKVRMTSVTLSEDSRDRFTISANLRAWYEVFELCEKFPDLPRFRAISKIVYQQTKGLVGQDSHIVSRVSAKLITDMDELTPAERMIHEDLTFKFTVDRGVTHELVRMRECSFAQESTRYCNYANGKFGSEITVIAPCFWDEGSEFYKTWLLGCQSAEKCYFGLLNGGAQPQEARDVLPTSVKADIAVTTNLLEWRHILELRACDKTGPAHPQMKEVMVTLLSDVKLTHDFSFGDLEVEVK